jgi:hypothetical protein
MTWTPIKKDSPGEDSKINKNFGNLGFGEA